MQQHQTIVDILTIYDYNVHLRPLPLGYAGSIYKTNITAVLKKLHINSVRCLHNYNSKKLEKNMSG